MAGRKTPQPPPLDALVALLRDRHGSPAPPAVTDPFQQILLEQVAYLATDEKRHAAFQLLATEVGLRPADILAATDETLTRIATAGGAIAAAKRAERLRESARIAHQEWDDDLAAVLALARAKALRALSRFGMIGKPGAAKILLLAGASRELALDSNGLRVLLRIGYGSEDTSYDRSYRSVIEELAAQPPLAAEAAIEAHQLLRRHGQTICRRATPRCAECPLTDSCSDYRQRA